MGSKSRFPQREVKCGTVSGCRLKHPQTQHAEIELEINLLRKRWNCERQSLTTSRIMIIWRAVEAIEEFRWIWCEGRINMITFLFPKTNHNIEMSISFSLISCPWVCLFCFSSCLSKTAISWTNLLSLGHYLSCPYIINNGNKLAWHSGSHASCRRHQVCSSSAALSG